jgi:hypothetical protein
MKTTKEIIEQLKSEIKLRKEGFESGRKATLKEVLEKHETLASFLMLKEWLLQELEKLK